MVEFGAREAARAVARLVKSVGFSVEGVDVMSARALAARHTPRALVVSFTVSGGLQGTFALVASEEHARRLALALVGGPAEALSRRQLGALTELGNIGVSAYLNGVAQRLGATCLPSVPSLLLDQSHRAVEAAFGASTGVHVARLALGAEAVDLALVVEP